MSDWQVVLEVLAAWWLGALFGLAYAERRRRLRSQKRFEALMQKWRQLIEQAQQDLDDRRCRSRVPD